MPILQAMDGRFYDVPDEQAAQYEVPRDKVKELLDKAGVPAPSSGQMPPQGPGPQGGGYPTIGAPTIAGPGGGPPVLVQIFGAPPQATGFAPPQAGPQPGAPEGQGQESEVNPYWWWRNVVVRPWGNWPNYWANWRNW